MRLEGSKSRYDHKIPEIPGERKRRLVFLILRGVFYKGWYETTYLIRLLGDRERKSRVIDDQKNHTIYSVYVRKKIKKNRGFCNH